MKDLRQSPAWANYLKSINWTVEKINGNYYFLKKLPIVGHLLKVQRTKEVDLEVIKKLNKKYKIWKTAVEPLKPHINKLISHGFKLSKSFYLPTKTIQIDLRKSQEKLLKEMSPKTRYNIKLAQKKNLIIKKSNDIEKFANFWRENFERKRFLFMTQKKNIIKMHKAFDKSADLLLALNNQKLIAGLLILRTKNTAYYMYAASNSEGRKLFAPTLLIWEAIKPAKRTGCKIFDFDGIYDERFPLKSWQGFTKFKKGFGGYEVEYPGCYILR